MGKNVIVKTLLFTILALLFFIPKAQAAITLTQSTTSFPGTVSSSATLFNATPILQGDMIYLCLRIGAGNRTFVVSDSLGNTYTQAASSTNSLDGHEIFVYYALNSNPGALDWIYATSSGATVTTRVIGGVYSGVATVNALEATATNQTNGATYVNTGTVVASGTLGSLLTECTGNNTANTYTAIAPYVLANVSTPVGGGHRLWWAGAVTGSTTPSGYITSSVSINYSSALAVFLPLAAPVVVNVTTNVLDIISGALDIIGDLIIY